MNTLELQEFLYQQIPLAKALGIRIQNSCEKEAGVFAPLGPNKNHLETAFGGSLSAILILSCYAWLFHRIEEEGLHAHVLIKSGNIDYLAPVEKDFLAICKAPPLDEYEEFLSLLKRKGRARMRLTATVTNASKLLCSFQGEFVAIKSARTEIS